LVPHLVVTLAQLEAFVAAHYFLAYLTHLVHHHPVLHLVAFAKEGFAAEGLC
jgi:hypothetical protein